MHVRHALMKKGQASHDLLIRAEWSTHRIFSCHLLELLSTPLELRITAWLRSLPF